MCNIYQFKSQGHTVDKFRAKVLEVAADMRSPLVRKTSRGVVVRSGGAVSLMRWGFRRDFNPAVNNARADKLASGMWADAWLHRRCVIPVTSFFEWGPEIGGKKQAHEISDPHHAWLWMAGLWEEHPDLGPCYSMVTTAAGPAMIAIHDRMPAILDRNAANSWLKGQFSPEEPFAGPLVVEPCESPLTYRHGKADGQDELF